MRPTARAEELREPLRLALEALEQAVAPAAPFDPTQSRHTWRVAATDYAESAILLPILASLRRQAPGSRLAVLELAPTRIVRQAERGEIDLAFHTLEEAPPGLRCRRLFSERYVLAGRAGHPGLRRRPTLKQFCRLEQAIVSPDGGGFPGPTDQALAELGAERRVALSVPHFLFLRAVLESTDLVALLPSRLVRERDGCGWSRRPWRCPATTWPCSGTSARTAIRPIAGCANSSPPRCNAAIRFGRRRSLTHRRALPKAGFDPPPGSPWREVSVPSLAPPAALRAPFRRPADRMRRRQERAPPKPAEVTTYNSVPWDALPATSDADLLAGFNAWRSACARLARTRYGASPVRAPRRSPPIRRRCARSSRSGCRSIACVPPATATRA